MINFAVLNIKELCVISIKFIAPVVIVLILRIKKRISWNLSKVITDRKKADSLYQLFMLHVWCPVANTTHIYLRITF